ncbi:MAG: alanyl-tRNA editing protein, partial [Cellulosilyticaceae bacterium]
MSKLYDTHPYLQDFIAEVTEVTEQDGAFHIVLNQTAFYPTGGGQPCDTGMIEDCKINDVYEKDGTIYHVSSKKPIKIHKVKCTIDWARRLDHMQHHLAQHLLSALLLEDHNAQTLSFHLGREICTLDIDQILDATQLQQIFEKANHLIRQCIPVTCFYPTKQELKKLKLRKLPQKGVDAIRLVQIGALSIDACCGIHPQSTLELMHCSLLKSEKYKGGLRLHFIAGFRSINHLAATATDTQAALTEATSKAQKALSEANSLRLTIEDYEAQALLQQTPTVGGYQIIQEVYDNKSIKDLQRFANKLVASPNTITLLALKEAGMGYLVFMCSAELRQLNMSKLLQDSVTFIDGRGGGTPTAAQGGGKGINNLDSALLYANTK